MLFRSPAWPTLKAIKHVYNKIDGSTKLMKFYPYWPATTDSRTFLYKYYNNGKLKSIENGLIGDEKFAEYEYNIDGSVDIARYGVSHYFDFQTSTHYDDTTQVIKYSYDTRGMVIGIGDTLNMVAQNNGSGEDSLHFGLSLEYVDDTANQYFNGRVATIKSRSSNGSTILNNDYSYHYNKLSWLTFADNIDDDNLDREYTYNRLGNRDTLYAGNDTIVYTYETDTSIVDPGSSRLLNYTGMISNCTYDVIGNMLSDPSKKITQMFYDYRNLMYYSKFTATASATSYDYLTMAYDETGMRISKDFTYKYWDDCGGVIDPPFDLLLGAGSTDLTVQSENSSMSTIDLGGGGIQALGSGGEQCLKTATTHTYYLYDNGVLLATFDENDNILETFVNSQEGMIASYKNNDNDKLYYYMRDQIGSPRAILHSTPTASTKTLVAQSIYYHPFGAVSVAIGSYDTPYKFTGKEHDLHGNFEFTYFGSRYYNPETGYFSSIDKAGQFTNGYLYGGNNPTLGQDPDGNLFFLAAPFLYGAAFGMGSYTLQFAQSGNWSEFSFGKMLLHGAVGGVVGSITAPIYNGTPAQAATATSPGVLAKPGSAIAGSAFSSVMNSMGGHLISGTPVSANLGFGTFGPDGFNFNDLSTLSGAMSWLTVGEDLGKLKPFRGETILEAQARQIKEKAGNPFWEAIGEPDLTIITPEELKALVITSQVEHSTADAPYSDVMYENGEVRASEDHGNMGVRFGGNTHLDGGSIPDKFGAETLKDWSKPELWNLHNDFFGSGLQNPFTMIQHVVFESGIPIILPKAAANVLYHTYRNNYAY